MRIEIDATKPAMEIVETLVENDYEVIVKKTLDMPKKIAITIKEKQ